MGIGKSFAFVLVLELEDQFSVLIHRVCKWCLIGGLGDTSTSNVSIVFHNFFQSSEKFLAVWGCLTRNKYGENGVIGQCSDEW